VCRGDILKGGLEGKHMRCLEEVEVCLYACDSVPQERFLKKFELIDWLLMPQGLDYWTFCHMAEKMDWSVVLEKQQEYARFTKNVGPIRQGCQYWMIMRHHKFISLRKRETGESRWTSRWVHVSTGVWRSYAADSQTSSSRGLCRILRCNVIYEGRFVSLFLKQKLSFESKFLVFK